MATGSHGARRDSDVELSPMVDRDRVAVTTLYHRIRDVKDHVLINTQQAKHLSSRVSAALATLARMPSARPTPQLVAVVRSVAHLLETLANPDDSWRFLLLHFTARNVFQSMRERLSRVWSLLPSGSWAREDAEAAEIDDKENYARLVGIAREGNEPIPAHVSEILQDRDAVVAHYRRRSGMSGWKLHVGHLDIGSDVGRVPAALAGLGPEADFTGLKQADRRDRFVVYRGQGTEADHIRYCGRDVSILEVPPNESTSDHMENFIVDAVHRFGWWHPHLTQVLGAYTEGVALDGSAFVVMALVEEDLALQRFDRMDRVIFDQGQRVGLHAAVTIALKVSEAMQYARFDSYDVRENIPLAWCSAPPSATYVRPAEPAGSPGTRSLEHLTGTCDVDVRFSPPPSWADGRVSRWTPPSRAVCPEAYGIGLLIVALLTNQPPFQGIDDCEVLKASSDACAPPYRVPKEMPWDLRQFCRRAFAVKDEPGFKSMQHCRSQLLALYDLGSDFPAPHSQTAVEPVSCHDYGVRPDVEAH